MADKFVRLKQNTTYLLPKTRSTLIDWGGPDMSGRFSAMDAAICDDLSANRFAGLPDECFVFERSTDAGKTWTVVSGQSGQAIVTSSGSFSNSNTTTSQTIDARHRITITIAGYVYCELRKLLIFLSTNGATGCKCSVIYGDYSTPTVWSVAKTAPVSGWSGWNVINLSQTIGSSTYGYVKYLRLEFSITGMSSAYYSNLTVYRIRAFSNNCWRAPTELAITNRIYTTNNARDVNFPANATVTATKFKGALEGNANTATLATNSQNLGAQAPAYYLNWNNFTNKPTFGMYATTVGSTIPTSVSNPYIIPTFDNLARTGVRLVGGNGISISSDSVNNINVNCTLAGISTFSGGNFTPYTTQTGIYKWNASEKRIYYNGQGNSDYLTLDRSAFDQYIYVMRTNGTYTAWYVFTIGPSGTSNAICYGLTSSTQGFYQYVNMPSPDNSASTLATTALATTSTAGLMSSTDKTKLNGISNGANNYSLPIATGSVLGGVKLAYTNAAGNSNRRLVADSSGNAYTDVGLNIQYSSLSNTFGNGAGHMVRINDTQNNNRYLFVWGETGSMADGTESTWSFPAAITGASPSSAYFVFQQKGDIGSAVQYNNGTVIKTLTTSSITIRQNTNATNTFCYSGFFRW